MGKRLKVIITILIVLLLITPSIQLLFHFIFRSDKLSLTELDVLIIASMLGLVLLLCAFFVFVYTKLHYRLRQQHKLYNTMLKSTNSLVILWNTALTYTEFNEYAHTTIDKDKHTLDSSFVKKLFGDNDKSRISFDEVPPKARMLTNALDPRGHQFCFTSTDGELHHVVFNSVKLNPSGKDDYYILSISTDISDAVNLKNELMETNKRLKLNEEMHSLAMESAEIGILMYDMGEHNNLHLSENAHALLGFPKDDIITVPDFRAHIHPDDLSDYLSELNKLKTGKKLSFGIEARMRIDAESYSCFMLKFKSTKDSYGNVIRIIGAIININQQKEISELIDKTTFEDELTKLPNRRCFLTNGNQVLENIHQQYKLAALIYFDIDRFKRVNNLSGYAAGDELLRSVAATVTNIIGDDVFFARLGADDFGLILPVLSQDEAEAFCESLENAVSGLEQSLTIKEAVSISIGACLSDPEGSAITSMFEKASMALTVAKTSTYGNTQFFSQDVRQLIIDRDILEEEIREAYIKGEFSLYYQPKIDIKTSKLIGVEALMRWNHPTKGIISPGVFIPVAEEIGLITKLDEWGMREACHQCKQWQDLGHPPIAVSVNISQAMFYQTDLVALIRDVLKESNLQPDLLEIELTETMAIKDINKTVEILGEIQRLGCHVSMDDFGTGYSSLSSLKLVPINILKIDRSLIIDVETNNTSKYIISAIIGLAKSMNLKTLAEGVETAGQVDFLNTINCDFAQGYYYGKPCPSDVFESLYISL